MAELKFKAPKDHLPKREPFTLKVEDKNYKFHNPFMLDGDAGFQVMDKFKDAQENNNLRAFEDVFVMMADGGKEDLDAMYKAGANTQYVIELVGKVMEQSQETVGSTGESKA